MALTDWIQTAAAIYFAWQQNRIFKRQNEIIAAQSKRTAAKVEISWTVRVKRYWPTYAMLALIGVTAYDIYDRHHTEFGYDPNLAWEDNKPLERVYQPHFTNQTVNVDGKNFIDPVFDNVTLVYNGKGPFSMENPQWVRHNNQLGSRLASRNKVVNAAFLLHCALTQAGGCQTACVNMGPNPPEGIDIPPLSK